MIHDGERAVRYVLHLALAPGCILSLDHCYSQWSQLHHPQDVRTGWRQRAILGLLLQRHVVTRLELGLGTIPSPTLNKAVPLPITLLGYRQVAEGQWYHSLEQLSSFTQESLHLSCGSGEVQFLLSQGLMSTLEDRVSTKHQEMRRVA